MCTCVRVQGLECRVRVRGHVSKSMYVCTCALACERECVCRYACELAFECMHMQTGTYAALPPKPWTPNEASLLSVHAVPAPDSCCYHAVLCRLRWKLWRSWWWSPVPTSARTSSETGGSARVTTSGVATTRHPHPPGRPHTAAVHW